MRKSELTAPPVGLTRTSAAVGPACDTQTEAGCARDRVQVAGSQPSEAGSGDETSPESSLRRLMAGSESARPSSRPSRPGPHRAQLPCWENAHRVEASRAG